MMTHRFERIIPVKATETVNDVDEMKTKPETLLITERVILLVHSVDIGDIGLFSHYLHVKMSLRTSVISLMDLLDLMD